MSIAVAGAADKDKARFSPGPASSFASKQTIEKVTVAVSAHDTGEEAKLAFGKVNPTQEGVLPVLVVIQNDTGKALRMDELTVELVTADRSRIEPTPAGEVKYLAGGERPKLNRSPVPTGSPRMSRRKNKLDTWEIEGRAFAAKMLPPGESANGFFYFQAYHRPGSKVYLTGLREAATGKELFYFEIPLDE
jgi:hypothetical protein